MNRVSLAGLTILLELNPVRIVFLIFHGGIVAPLAVAARKCDDLASCGLSHGEIPLADKPKGPNPSAIMTPKVTAAPNPPGHGRFINLS